MSLNCHIHEHTHALLSVGWNSGEPQAHPGCCLLPSSSSLPVSIFISISISTVAAHLQRKVDMDRQPRSAAVSTASGEQRHEDGDASLESILGGGGGESEGSDLSPDDDDGDDDGSDVTVSEAMVTIHPGFRSRGQRMSHRVGQVECSMSYSAFGGAEEQWSVTITETPFEWTCLIKA
jgi:hypothetical protein